MKTEVPLIQNTLHELLSAHTPPLQIRIQTETTFEVAGTKPGMQGKQKVDGYYFATVMPKPKDARFYFYPLYTHAEAFDLSPALKKYLKGKTCFHIKKMSTELEVEIQEMIAQGVALYVADGLI
ncbi:MAG: hypothetical protein AB8G86_17775 [Saprospiraceae bacterium]